MLDPSAVQLSRLVLGQASDRDKNNTLDAMGIDTEDVLCGRSPFLSMLAGLHPFEDKTSSHGPSNFGVIAIRNIPYNVTKSEIIHFLGRSTPLISAHTDGWPVHIIMERPTSKTMDCFVELLTPQDAKDAFQRHENLVMGGKHPKIGTRHVILEVSNQDELVENLFPRARGLIWKNGVPEREKNVDPYSGGFRGFFTTEEMVGMVRHAQTPQRSPFSIKCLQRTFECMISTLYKFPWGSTMLYTLEDRNTLFTVYVEQLHVLTMKVAEGQTVGLDQKLMFDFLLSGMNCPGFGERMKAEIRNVAGAWGKGIDKRSEASWELSHRWPFELLSRPKIGPGGVEWNDEVVQFYLLLIDLGVWSLEPLERFSGAVELLVGDNDNDNRDLSNARFTFRKHMMCCNYDAALELESQLMQAVITVGYEEFKESVRDVISSGRVMSERMKQDVRLVNDLQHLQVTRKEEIEADLQAQGQQVEMQMEMIHWGESLTTAGEGGSRGVAGRFIHNYPEGPIIRQQDVNSDTGAPNTPSTFDQTGTPVYTPSASQATPSGSTANHYATPVRNSAFTKAVDQIIPFVPRSTAAATDSLDRRYSEPRYLELYTDHVNHGMARPLAMLPNDSSPLSYRRSSSSAVEIRTPDDKVTGNGKNNITEKLANLNSTSSIEIFTPSSKMSSNAKPKPISPPKPASMVYTPTKTGNGNGNGSQRKMFSTPSTITEEDHEEFDPADAKNLETFGLMAMALTVPVGTRATAAAYNDKAHGEGDEDQVVMCRGSAQRGGGGVQGRLAGLRLD